MPSISTVSDVDNTYNIYLYNMKKEILNSELVNSSWQFSDYTKFSGMMYINIAELFEYFKCSIVHVINMGNDILLN